MLAQENTRSCERKEMKYGTLRGMAENNTYVVTAMWTLDSDLSKNGDARIWGNKERKWALVGIFIFYTSKSLYNQEVAAYACF